MKKTNKLIVIVLIFTCFLGLFNIASAENKDIDSEEYQLTQAEVNLIMNTVQNYIKEHGEKSFNEKVFKELLKEINLGHVRINNDNSTTQENTLVSRSFDPWDSAIVTPTVLADTSGMFVVSFSMLNTDLLDTHDAYEFSWCAWIRPYPNASTSFSAGAGKDIETFIKPLHSRVVTHGIYQSVTYGAWFEFNLKCWDDGVYGYNNYPSITNKYY